MTKEQFLALKEGDRIVMDKEFAKACGYGTDSIEGIVGETENEPTSNFKIAFWQNNLTGSRLSKRPFGFDFSYIISATDKITIKGEQRLVREFLSLTLPPLTYDKPVKKTKAIEATLMRKGGHTMFSFTIIPQITEFYKKIAKETKDSEGWTGLKFYSVPDITTNKTYQEKLRRINLCDDFGTPVLKDGRLNIAWLRTVGGKGEIELPQTLSLEEGRFLIDGACKFIKEHLQEYLQEYEIRGVISLEI